MLKISDEPLGNLNNKAGGFVRAVNELVRLRGDGIQPGSKQIHVADTRNPPKSQKILGSWWHDPGTSAGFKIQCPQGREGSSPSSGTL